MQVTILQKRYGSESKKKLKLYKAIAITQINFKENKVTDPAEIPQAFNDFFTCM